MTPPVCERVIKIVRFKKDSAVRSLEPVLFVGTYSTVLLYKERRTGWTSCVTFVTTKYKKDASTQRQKILKTSRKTGHKESSLSVFCRVLAVIF